jgi:hypothetical protein
MIFLPHFFFRMGCKLKKGNYGQELGVPFIAVSAPLIVSGMSGESEKTLRETFEEAKVRAFHPCRGPNHLNTTHGCRVESGTLSAIH